MRLLIVLLAIAGCATPLPAEVPKEAGAAAIARYGECISDAANRMDDGVSDATTIAIAADMACAESSQLVTDTFGASQSTPYAKDAFAKDIRGEKLGFATSIVVGVRNGTIH